MLLVAGVLLATVYYLFDPSRMRWPLKCPFRLLTGWECPSCGNQRALHSFLHGQWAEAWSYNPFLWISLPYIVLLLAGYVLRNRDQRLWDLVSRRWVVMTYVVLIMLWWIIRNVT